MPFALRYELSKNGEGPPQSAGSDKQTAGRVLRRRLKSGLILSVIPPSRKRNW